MTASANAALVIAGPGEAGQVVIPEVIGCSSPDGLLRREMLAGAAPADVRFRCAAGYAYG